MFDESRSDDNSLRQLANFGKLFRRTDPKTNCQRQTGIFSDGLDESGKIFADFSALAGYSCHTNDIKKRVGNRNKLFNSWFQSCRCDKRDVTQFMFTTRSSKTVTFFGWQVG
eukprot:Lithocolla_globosa_v1_NODE_2110_length_2162_cov_22.530138.p3 type:complete len:112 gc:universal NODE_2110_length_2162_cov_22.530138:744-409(-)